MSFECFQRMMKKYMEPVFYMTSHTQGQQLFSVYDCGTHYSNCHLVIFHNKIDSIYILLGVFF